MILFKIGNFIFFALFLIWMSNFDKQLYFENSYCLGHQQKKNPSKLLNVILLMLILFGCGIMSYFIPIDKVGISLGTVFGIFIASIAFIARRIAYN